MHCTDAQIMEVRIRLQNPSPLSSLGDRQILDIFNALLPSQIVERSLLVHTESKLIFSDTNNCFHTHFLYHFLHA
jgi:hypothetical protein